jgi:hypothetical protein
MNTLDRVIERWYGYWFRPAPLFDLAVFRIILTGSHVLWYVLFLHASLVEQATTDPSLYKPLPLLKILTLDVIGEPRVLSLGTWELIFWIAVASGAAACIGLFTNVALVICAVTSNAFHLFINSFTEMHHPEAAMSIALAILALAPCGRLLSVDAMLAPRTSRLPLNAESAFAGWPAKLLMCLFAVFYLSAVKAKLTRDGVEWLNGFTLQYYLAMDGLRWDRPVAVWLASLHWVAFSLQVAIVAFQATFWTALVSARLRWIYIPAGLVIHAGFWFILNAPFPQWLACYAAFIPWWAVLQWRWLGREREHRVEATA